MRGILAGLLLVFASQLAQADNNFGMAGCGLGSMVMGSSGNQILAATTNATGIQGFGISSGTSNCLPANQAAAVQAQEKFFATNLQVLSKELAQGQGDYVKALAHTMGCKENVHGAFAAEMQKSYSHIFSAPGTGAMLSRVRSTIHENSQLNASCNTII